MEDEGRKKNEETGQKIRKHERKGHKKRKKEK